MTVAKIAVSQAIGTLGAPAGGRETCHQFATMVVLVVMYLSLVIGGLIPKRLALHSPKRVARLHAKEFLTVAENIEVRTLLRQPVVVPEQTPALKVLETFRRTTPHIALIIHEYGVLAWSAQQTFLNL